MSFVYKTRILADLTPGRALIQGEAALGGFLLRFPVDITPIPWEIDQPEPMTLSIMLEELRGKLYLKDRYVGELSPNVPWIGPILPLSVPVIQPTTRNFTIRLEPAALEMVEHLRAGEDLDFRLHLMSTGKLYPVLAREPTRRDILGPNGITFMPSHGYWFPPVNMESDVHFRIPQSEWVKLLSSIGYGSSMLYEIPWDNIGDLANGTKQAWENARKAFSRDEYTAAVGYCRQCFDTAPKLLGAEAPVWGKAGDKTKRQDMTLPERTHLILMSVRHLTHLAHHDASPDRFSREQARHILGMTALCFSLMACSPGSFIATPESENAPVAPTDSST
jgi:hypothetical protein